jgi:heme/copper-type cytochrome/quinol oxidase subunit 3
VKDLTGSNGAGPAADVGAAAVARSAREAQRWAREVLRRGALELLYLGSNLAITGGGLLWLYQLLTRKPAFKTGLIVAAALGISLFAYHFARWRASANMSRQVEKLTASLIVTLSMALVWGGICCAFTIGGLRWFSAPGTVSWMIGATAGLCGFAYMVAGEWSDLSDCLALPAAESQKRQSDESVA